MRTPLVLLGGLRARILLLVGLAVVPALVLELVQTVSERREATRQARKESERVAGLAAAAVGGSFEGARLLLTGLAQSGAATEPEECAGLLELVQHRPEYSNLGSFGASGEVVCSAVPAPPRTSVAASSWFGRAVEAREFAVGSFEADPITGSPTVLVALPVADPFEGVRAVLFASLNPSALAGLVERASLPEGSSLNVLDGEGTVIYRYPDPQRWIGVKVRDHPLIRAIIANRRGTIETEGIDGVRRVFSFAPVPSAGQSVFVAVGIPRAVQLAGADRRLAAGLVTLGAVALLAVAAAWGGGTSLILRPVRAIVEAARKLQDGDLSARTGITSAAGEIGRLAEAFDRMAAELQARENERVAQAEVLTRRISDQVGVRTRELQRAKEELERSLGLLRATLESTVEGILSLDLAGRPVAWNRRFVEVWRMPEEVLLLGDGEGLAGAMSLRVAGAALDPVHEARTDPEAEVWGVVELADGRIVERQSLPQRSGDRVVGTVWSFRDVTERMRAEAELRAAKEEAERANTAKTRFLSRMSHELRTPLNAIIGFAQLLDMNPGLPPDDRDNAAEVLKAGRHLLNLVDEVLDITRIEEGGMPLSMEPVSVRDVAEEVMAIAGPQAARRGIVIEPLPQGVSGPWVLADRERLLRILLNMLANGVKYNVPGGRVGVAWEVEHGRVRVLVSDTGPGIPADRLGELFSPFERLGAERLGEVEGTGLGLALCRSLAEAMAGSVGVESEQGKGSVFWVELPAAVPPEATEPGAEVERPETPAPVKIRTLLLIEDNPSNVRLIEQVVARRPSLRLISAMKGALGLDLAREHRPDLVLLDLHLPDVSGEEVLRRLREDPATRAIPVVVASADAAPGTIERLVAAGARAYLTKPLNLRRLVEVMDETLSP